ncbi:hypothetical protein [Sandaracinobacteroides saxicola]|uniref:Gluconate 2-dehydrogenase subunit 3 family protein n=1 Tax=Sandaracinobacteroides saxicola TaxID=2759707 RepID=A0A7G5IIA4_9SPHN|nr:hypothetical protein [Sandaracinobacteroides saxicola]QMW23096.1 hypothetical protein H3309_00830 [Sandaracinobacteroides saxicola]
MLGRRRLLLAGAATALALALPLRAAPAPSLLQAARDLFPHDDVPDADYAATLAGLSPELTTTLVGLLDTPTVHASLSPAERKARMAVLLPQPAMQALRATVMIGLYGNLAVTRRFGYQGPSLADGGYLDRGFDALPWLPRAPRGGGEPWWP